MYVVALFIVGLLVLLTILAPLAAYVLLYRHFFDRAIDKHVKASEEGKRPILLVGGLWFKFYEDLDLSQLTEEVRETIVLAGMVAVNGRSMMYFTRRFPFDDL